MIVEIKAARGKSTTDAVRKFVLTAKTKVDHDILTALAGLWMEKPDDFCKVIKDRVRKNLNLPDEDSTA